MELQQDGNLPAAAWLTWQGGALPGPAAAPGALTAIPDSQGTGGRPATGGLASPQCCCCWAGRRQTLALALLPACELERDLEWLQLAAARCLQQRSCKDWGPGFDGQQWLVMGEDRGQPLSLRQLELENVS